MKSKVILQYTDNSNKQTRRYIADGRPEIIRIGCNTRSNLRIQNDPLVHGFHAVIELETNGDANIIAMESSVTVNNEVAKSSPLKKGDVVKVGNTYINVVDIITEPVFIKPIEPARPPVAVYESSDELPKFKGIGDRAVRVAKEIDGIVDLYKTIPIFSHQSASYLGQRITKVMKHALAKAYRAVQKIEAEDKDEE